MNLLSKQLGDSQLKTTSGFGTSDKPIMFP